MRRYIAGVVVFGGAPLVPGSTALAQMPIAVSGGPYKLSEVDGKHTLTITVTNTTGTAVTASLTPSTDDPGCDIQADPDEVGANRSVALKFTLPSACDLGDKETDLTLSVRGPEGLPLSVPVTAESPDEMRTQGAVPVSVQLAELHLDRGERPSCPEEGRLFYLVLVRALLHALEAERPARAAFGDQLRSSLPSAAVAC